MFKKSIFLGITSGILAGISCIVYAYMYKSSLEVDFSKVVKPQGMIGACVFVSLLAAIVYFLFSKWMKKYGEIVFNFLFVILTFASLVIPFAISLPLDVQSPELFPGFAVPMHFFPALGWFTLKPLFIK